MAGIILCRTKVAQNPFFISNMGINIYSMEELCYYIYNNIYLIGIDLVDEELIKFIGEELGESGLAQRLTYLKKAKAGLAELVITILKYVDYYDSSEIEQVRETLESINTRNVYERLKMRADTLLENKKYIGAIKNYEKIIQGEKDLTLPGIFYAKVYHNLGCAYGNMFLYDKARDCFAKAYETGQHEESKKCLIAARLLDENYKKTAFTDENDDEAFVFSREIEAVLDDSALCPDCVALNQLETARNNGNGELYYEQLKAMIDGLKKKYAQYTS
ncbi:MAG: hypothetical protein ACI4EV_03550 [Lachnospiraceae bacterium]